MAIRDARLELLALSASCHKRMINVWAESREESVDFVRRNRLFR